ncbi:MAG: winged helix DNA-binding domain-containing protein [Sphingobacteriales bacterium]|nr:MAG: winged helix DNA-binding domain-containing protein [Sphingobacteriales bacterium]
MKLTDIAGIRLQRQQIISPEFNKPEHLVAYMGAVQAQDYNMSKLAVGLRVPGATDVSIEAALDKGLILRTHVLRPTWHYVHADDIYWMMALTGPRIRTAFLSMDKILGLSADIYTKSKQIFSKALEGGNNLTRDELAVLLQNANISTSDNRLSHILAEAEINSLICSGAKKDGQRTYALLPDRVPAKKAIPKDEALAMLAERYFTSHGPATLKDFIWWSGLTVGEARDGLESILFALESETIGEETYYFSPDVNVAPRQSSLVHLMPAYDEFLISYKDRTASLQHVHNRKIVSINGIFRPIFLVDGQVEGLWKMTAGRDGIDIMVDSFKKLSTAIVSKAERAAEAISKFYDKPVTTSFISQSNYDRSARI